MANNEIPGARLRLYLVRHGEVANFSERVVNGQKDVRLSERGEEQTQKVADELSRRPITAIYSSDLYRSRRGAELLGQKLGLKVVLMRELREMHFGEVEGLGWAEAVKRLGDSPLQWFDWVNNRFPGGENLLMLRERVIGAFRKITGQDQGETAIFAHGGVNRVILCEELGIDLKNFFVLDQSYACVNVLEYYSYQAKVIRLINGDISCLGPLLRFDFY